MTPWAQRLVPIAVLLALAGCSSQDFPLVGRPAATMDGHSIAMSDYNRRLHLYEFLREKQGPQGGQKLPDLASAAGRGDKLKLEDRAAIDLVAEVLLHDEAQRRKLSVSEEDINQQVAAARALFKTDAEFQKGLRDYGYNLDGLREQLRGRLTEIRVVDAIGADRAHSALKDLKAGMPFSEVAKKWSDYAGDPEVTLTPAQQASIDPAAVPALQALKPDEISQDVVRGVNGYFLFHLISQDADATKVQLVYVAAPDREHYRLAARPKWFVAFLAVLEKRAHVKYNVGSRAA